MRYSIISGVVLKRQPVREADELLTVWSWERGKVRLLVRGLRRSRSRLKAAVLPLAWMEYQVMAGRGLPLVIGTRIVRSYQLITTELERAVLVLGLFELVLRLTADEAPNPELSLLLRQCLAYLERQRVEAGFFVKVRLRLLTALGYRMSLSQCGVCGCRLDQVEFSWSFLAGGPLCGQCASTTADGVKIEAGFATAVEALQRTEDVSVDATDIAPVVLESLDRWLSQLFIQMTERPLLSSRLLYELERAES